MVMSATCQFIQFFDLINTNLSLMIQTFNRDYGVTIIHPYSWTRLRRNNMAYTFMIFYIDYMFQIIISEL